MCATLAKLSVVLWASNRVWRETERGAPLTAHPTYPARCIAQAVALPLSHDVVLVFRDRSFRPSNPNTHRPLLKESRNLQARQATTSVQTCNQMGPACIHLLGRTHSSGIAFRQ